MKKLLIIILILIGCTTVVKKEMTFKMIQSKKDYVEVYTCFQSVASKFSKERIDSTFGSSQINVDMGKSTIIFSFPKSISDGSNITIIEPTNEIMKYVNECKGD